MAAMTIPQDLLDAADDMAEWGSRHPETHPSISVADIRHAMRNLKPQETQHDPQNAI